VVRLTCPCRVSHYKPGQLLSLQLGAAFRELAWPEIVSGLSGAEAPLAPLSAGRPAGRLVFPVGLRSLRRGVLSGLPVGWWVGTTTSRPRDRASPSKTACRFAWSFPRLPGRSLGGPVGTPLMGFKDRPSADISAARPLPGRPKSSLRPGGANLRARSVLAVPPDSDGLLRSAPCRSIAPCNRPWGSPCFWVRSLPRYPKAAVARQPHPRWRRPFEAFPSLVAVPCHHGLCPLAVPCRFAVLSARVAACFRPGPAGRPTSGL
jgi:hypothetical protein